MITPLELSSGGRPSSWCSSSPSPRLAWNGVTLASPSRAAAHTASAVPDSSSRPAPSTPPAPHPTSAPGESAVCTPSSIASGATRWVPLANTTARSAAAPPSSSATARPATVPASSESCSVEIAVPIFTFSTRLPTNAMLTRSRSTILRAMARADVIALFGPTGVGKTQVAVELANQLRELGERPVAVSADALQVYAGLERLTGVATPAQRAQLEHRLISFLPLDAQFSAGQYAELAHAEIDALLAEGERPIVVGGTGLYLRAALTELSLRPPPPEGARERWTAELERQGPAALHAVLAERAPWAAAGLAPTDRQRIVRALELLEAGELDPHEGESELWTGAVRRPTLLLGLVVELEQLYARIDARVEEMLAAGVQDEVRK